MFRALLRNVEAALRHDPAARSKLEVLLAYPGVHALALHRVSHLLWVRNYRLAARLSSHYTRWLTGVEIHPGATIADGVFIDHGMGVVIGETAVIEEGCIIYKGVVLGGTSLERRVRHPHLHRNVIVGSNACVLGAIHVGEGARIGSASVVIKDVPPGATVVGVPGRIVREKHPAISDELDHAHLPDPVAEIMRSLAHHQEAMADRLARLEEKLKLPVKRETPLEEELAIETDLLNDGPDGDGDPNQQDPRRRAGSIF
ncbi:MAG: serine O-acetyltransferase [Myxococcaceae bacterium]